MKNPLRSRPTAAKTADEFVDITDDPAVTTEQMRAAFNALPIGVVVNDAAGNKIVRNQKARHLVGDYQADALLRSAIERVSQRAAKGYNESEVVDVYGPVVRTFTVTGEALVGSGAGSIVTIEDTSERQRIEQMRRDFVANVSHELRTPVGAIVLLAETLSDESDPNAVAMLNNHIASEAKRAEHLVEELLNLSRLEVVRKPSYDSLLIEPLIGEAVSRVEPLAAQRRILLETKMQKTSIVLWGDRGELLSAIVNLLENAVKYSDAGSVVHVGADIQDGFCEIRVRDEGIGIPAKDLDRVFERFYRVDPARSRDTGGAGLGLSIVRHVATNHGGDVSVKSREGEGSVFTLSIPLTS